MKITIQTTDSEDAAILATTGQGAQAFIEVNARTMIADCVLKTRHARAVAAGLTPAIYDAGLPTDEIEECLVRCEARTAERKAREAFEARVAAEALEKAQAAARAEQAVKEARAKAVLDEARAAAAALRASNEQAQKDAAMKLQEELKAAVIGDLASGSAQA